MHPLSHFPPPIDLSIPKMIVVRSHQCVWSSCANATPQSVQPSQPTNLPICSQTRKDGEESLAELLPPYAMMIVFVHVRVCVVAESNNSEGPRGPFSLFSVSLARKDAPPLRRCSPPNTPCVRLVMNYANAKKKQER